MRPIVILSILATLTAACATPRRAPRPVVVHRAPTVVEYEEPVVVTTPPVYTGTYSPAGGGAATTTGTSSGTYTPTPAHLQKNPVPGSVREYINRYPSSGAMAK